MKNEIKLRIGKELLKLRIDNDYSLNELSKKANIKKTTLYKYEKGLGNCFETLEKILKVYNMNYEKFFSKIYDNMQNNS